MTSMVVVVVGLVAFIALLWLAVKVAKQTSDKPHDGVSFSDYEIRRLLGDKTADGIMGRERGHAKHTEDREYVAGGLWAGLDRFAERSGWVDE